MRWVHHDNENLIMIPATATTTTEMMGEEEMASSNNDLSMELPLIGCATRQIIINAIIITTTGHSINHTMIGEGEDRIDRL